MLTWLAEEPSLFPVVSRYIGAGDFTEPLYRETAQILFDQLREGKLNPAQIVSRFADEEQQKEIAALFHEKIYPVEGREKKEKALTETILKVKQSSLDDRSAQLDPTDMEGLQQILNDQKKLDEIRRLHISID